MKITTRFSLLKDTLRGFTLFGLLTLAATFSASGQSNPIFPNTQVLIQGTANQPGAVYLIENVELTGGINVDCILRIVQFAGTPIIGNVDNTQFIQNRFEPTITYDTAGEAVRWQMEFIVAGTADINLDDRVPFPLDSYTLEIIDLDAEEWAEVVVPASYELEGATPPGTIITPAAGTLVPNSIRFTSADITDPGVSTANTRSIVRINYTNVSLVDFMLGRDNNDPIQTRNISIGFLGEVVFGTTNTTVVNSPPVVTNQSTTTPFNTDSEFVNLLDGSSDPDGNLDPTTITLIDPNDPTNIGVPGTPLVIPGEGTYFVDDTGAVLFRPVSGFTGVSTINFRVEDTNGATSNLGTFTVTVANSIDLCDAAASGNANGDTDNLSDICDQDDDNDTIPDTDEQDCSVGFVDLGQTFTNTDTGTTNGSTSSGTIANLYSFGGTNASFSYDLFGDAEWSSGVQSATAGGVDGTYINVQPDNTDFTVADLAVYTFNFSEAVYNLEFKLGGLDNQDRADFVAFNGTSEVPVTLTDINLGGNGTFNGQSVISSAGGANAPSNRVQISIEGPVNRVVITTAKNNGNSGNITLQFHELQYCNDRDTDGDGIPDHLDPDSDGDGCPDSTEAPNLSDVTTATQVVVTTAPANQTEDSGDSASFSVVARGDNATSYSSGTPVYGTPGNANSGLNYQWYLGDPNAGGTIIDGTDTNFTNFNTATLNIANVTGLDGQEFCVEITHDNNLCIEEVRCATLTVNPLADVFITKTLDTAGPFETGDTISYTIVVGNLGTDTANNVVVSDTPSNITITGVTGGGCTGFPCTIPSIAAGSPANDVTITVTATIDSAGAFSNTASATADETDPDTTNNTDDGSDGNNGGNAGGVADLSINKTVDNTNPNIGDTISFTITITNDGPDDASRIQVSDVLPVGFTYVSDTATLGSYNFTSGIWTLIDPVLSGTSESLTIVATVNAPTGTPNEYINVAEVIMSDQVDPDSDPDNDDGDQSEDDEDSVVVDPNIPTSDLSLTKTASDLTPTVGDVITFTLQIDNDGPDDATGVGVLDMVPSGFASISNVSNGGVVIANNIEWSNLTVTTAGLTLTYDAVVGAPTGVPGEFTNIAEVVASDQNDPDSDPNNDDGDQSEDDEDSVTVDPMIVVNTDVDIAITKTVDTGNIAQPIIGTNVVFTIEVSNLSMNTATGIVIEEVLPTGYEFVDATASAGNYDANSGLWTIDVLNGNETATLVLTAKVVDNGDYVNIATLIDVDQTDVNGGNDSDSAFIEPNCMVVFNEISPNGDGVNDFFVVSCLDQFPNNVVRIYNRWGNIVFEKENYDNSFFGRSNGRANFQVDELLPVGTYYYTIDLGQGTQPMAGWLYINR